MSNTTQPFPTAKQHRKRYGFSKIAALLVIGLLGISCLICGGLGALIDKENKEELERADQLWEAGDTEDAATIYIDKLEWVDEARLPQVYERIITYYYDGGDEGKAAEYCTAAIEGGTDITFSREDLRLIYADASQVIEERKAEEVARRAEEDRLAEQAAALPVHKFNPSSRPGQSKSQLRAVIQPGAMTEQELRQLAVRLCDKYDDQAYGSFLVQFFASDVALDNWGGTGALRDSDWPVHLCNVTVETDTGGGLYANTFGLALDEQTGEARSDVLRE